MNSSFKNINNDKAKLKDTLKSMAEPSYAEFTRKLVPTKLDILGVRAPKLKKLAKDIAQSGCAYEYVNFAQFENYEETLLYGMVLGFIDAPFQELLNLLRGYLPYIENWAICDMTVGGLKQFKSKINKEEGFSFACECVKAPSCWHYRFGTVLFLRYFICDEYIEKILNLAKEQEREEYYAKMAAAWLLAETYLFYPNLTIKAIDSGDFSNWVVQKGLQKMIESNRISDEDKEFLRLKKKSSHYML